jgi:hypothetical protein
MHADASDVFVSQFDLAGVESDPDVDADGTGGVADRPSAPDRPRWSVEGGEEPVAGGF